ncbi:MAG: hypothetical protein L3J98_14920 [Gammaproteobacteria bacterium]|nr:hypothetical protein [Gammaproteobacteria bacterium]
MKIVSIILVMLVPVCVAHADAPLEGKYVISGPLDHNGSTKSGRSHIYFTITNDAAKKMFSSFDEKPTLSKCTGWNYKSQGGITCHEVESGKNYFCSFSINLYNGAIGAGLGGCF